MAVDTEQYYKKKNKKKNKEHDLHGMKTKFILNDAFMCIVMSVYVQISIFFGVTFNRKTAYLYIFLLHYDLSMSHPQLFKCSTQKPILEGTNFPNDI